MNTATGSGNDFTSYKKAWFTIEFESQQMGLDIRLNDITVFNIDNTGFMTLELPVNEYLIKGDNKISITAHPLFDDDDEQLDEFVEGTKVEVGLYVREDGEPAEKRKLIDKVLIRPEIAYWESSNEPVAQFIGDMKSKDHTPLKTKKDAHVLNFPGYGNYKKQVKTSWLVKNVATNLPRWAWQDGLIINDDPKTYESLLSAYSALHKALLNKNLDKVKEIAYPRSKELAIAYYLGDAEDGFVYSTLGKNIDHPTIKLYENLALEGAKLDILAGGKLARIMEGGHIQPIVFVDMETEQFYQPQFMWFKNKNNEWVLIR